MRNKIKQIIAVFFVMVATAVVWNAPVWAGTATQAELTGTQEDIELNKEVTINWEKNGSTVDYYFTPTENKRYLFVLTDNDDKLPGLYQGDDKLSWFSYYSTVDGKMYLQTPVLEAGTKYDIYFTSREGETEIQFGFYDDIWHGAEEIDNAATGIMKKGYIEDGKNYSRAKIYKITVPEDGAYEYRVSGLNPTGIADDDYDFDVDIYDEDGNWNSNQDSVPNWGGSSDACAFANLEAGKTYYLVLANYSVDNAYEYTLSRTNLGIELNSEKTLNWNEIGDYFYYHFIPEKTQSYLFTVSDNGDRVPQIGRTDETWKNMMYDVDGKIRLVTPVLEAGKEYTLYVPIAAGENSVRVGFYDNIWEDVNTLETPCSGTIGKGTKRFDGKAWYPSNRLYKVTVPTTTNYVYKVTGFNKEKEYSALLRFLNEDLSEVEGQREINDIKLTGSIYTTVKLEAGKTYYLRFSNYTLDSGVDYKIVINNLNIENAKNLGESAEGKLSASSDTTYKFVATEDKVYNFTDTKVSEDVKEFSIYDNDLNNISTNSIKKSKVTYNENNEPKVDYVTYKIYLKKGTYYINLNNTSDKETEYNIKVENEELVDIDSINLDSNYIEIEEGVKKAVKYTINPDNATFTSVDWKVSDTSIVSLGYVGNVMNIEALKEGECDITVTAKNGKKAVCHIVVKKAGDHKYDSTIEKASTSKDGKIIDKCSRCGDVKVAQIISHPTNVVLNNSNFVYDGKVKTPTVTVTSADGKTVDSANYDISYANGRKDAGTYDVKVTFKGNYTGSLTTKFTIAKANQSLKIKSPKKKMKVGAKAKIKIKANKGHGKVTYKVSNKKIAKIKKGKLVALKKGKVKLTVTLKATKNYNQKKVTITIKVK
ncbi:Ig-like domain-containing protein [Eubacterium ventriosum]|uniref:Bacterial group 2 Ig-like protein n=1 Tax=Eubacterium ventriosum ATCC 27560 TaxID=411463 RepID=A5Z918_9FIRM|nr:Ig-like domain-containing protein [Eubacterium ventriosum]EDM50262.1 bacterial group 2 Ig-like protein [Eubacterium ventriosum ATCC 27560]MBS5016486.1 Ig-like domain-containing protein [Eubacterium ventriosum]UWP37118.1 Ig-like domain-containing protein [Eubacterium ventriosum]